MENIDFKKMITASLLCLLIIMLWQFYMQKKYGPTPGEPTESSQPAEKKKPDQQPDQQPNQTAAAAGPEQPGLIQAASTDWQLQISAAEEKQTIVLGSRVKEMRYKAQINIDNQTAAIRDVLLSEHKSKVTDKETGYPLLSPAFDKNQEEKLSFSLGTMKIKRILPNRQETFQFDLSGNCWKLQPTVTDEQGNQTVAFIASIINQNNKEVFQVTKTYRYQPDNYDLELDLSFVNKSSAPVQVDSLGMIGPVGIEREDPRSDRRKTIAAYKTTSQVEVEKKDFTKIFKSPAEASLSNDKELPLFWFGTTNKFFAAVVHPLATQGDKTVKFLGNNQVNNDVLYREVTAEEKEINDTVGTRTNLVMEVPIPPNQPELSPKFHFQIYLGPIDKDIFDQEKYKSLQYEHLVNISSCSFEWLTFALLGLMKLVYKAVGNYGVAVIILVLVVRLLLHPITKKGQVSMMKMQKMGPKIEEIKKKYVGNKEEIQKKTMEIYKEQGATPILGCLPMLLQMPIWIALYSAVDSSIALRHQGLFPAGWHWLTDLSAPDRLIPFSVFGLDAPISIPLIGGIDAFNLLPILLAVGMFLQQKLTPQTSMSSSNPQMAQQQKMMLIMMPIMMLVFLYSAPSGLNLYIMASTFGGIIEQYIIRKHIREQDAKEAAGTVTASVKLMSKMGPKKKKPKPPVKFH